MTSFTSGFESESEFNVEHVKHETFGLVFENWLLELEQDMKELKTAANDHADSTESSETECSHNLAQLVDRVMGHYENYYLAKSESMSQDTLGMLNPAWLSKLESAFLWVGGWRPTMAFHLLYSTSGKQFEAGLSQLLGGLSPTQLVRVDKLQRETIKEEKELSEKLAAQQETVADSSMIELTRLVSEFDQIESQEQVKLALAPKEHEIEAILRNADDLRLGTLRKLVNLLSPIQAVHLFIGAAQLHLRIHEWGKDKTPSRTPT